MVNAETHLFAELTNELVMFPKVVMAITSKAENLLCTPFIALSSPEISTLSAALLMFLKLSPILEKSRLFFSLSSVDMVVAAPDSNCLLSNFISTIL